MARFGCIPVPITDYVLQPFEPELDWSSFSVPVLEADVPRMHEVLAAISKAKISEMQAGASYLIYPKPLGVHVFEILFIGR